MIIEAGRPTPDPQSWSPSSLTCRAPRGGSEIGGSQGSKGTLEPSLSYGIADAGVCEKELLRGS